MFGTVLSCVFALTTGLKLAAAAATGAGGELLAPAAPFSVPPAYVRWGLVVCLVLWHGATCSWPARWVRCRARLAGAARWLALASFVLVLAGPDTYTPGPPCLSPAALADIPVRRLLMALLPWAVPGVLGAVVVCLGLCGRRYCAGRPRGVLTAGVPPTSIRDHLGIPAPEDRAVAALNTDLCRRWLDEMTGAIQRLVREQTVSLREEILAALELRLAVPRESRVPTMGIVRAEGPQHPGPRRTQSKRRRLAAHPWEPAVPVATPKSPGACDGPRKPKPPVCPASPAGPMARSTPARTEGCARPPPAPATPAPILSPAGVPPTRSPTLRWADLPLSGSESEGSWTTVGPRGSRRPAPAAPPARPTGQTSWPTLQEAAALPIIARRRDPRKPAPAPDTALTPQEQEVRRLRAQIRTLEEVNKREKAARASLTEEERGLTKGQLQAKWAAERRAQRFGPPSEEGLTPAEQQMPRAQLRRRLADEAHRAWVQRQRDLGFAMDPCPECGRMRRRDGTAHMCFRPTWKFPADRRAGVQRRQEVVVSATGGDVRIGRQVAIDPEEVDRQLVYLQGIKQKIAEQAATGPPLPPKSEETVGAPATPTITLDEDEEDVPMSATSSRLVAAVSPGLRPRQPPVLVRNRFEPLFWEAAGAGTPGS
jgi:hypothetical protein